MRSLKAASCALAGALLVAAVVMPASGADKKKTTTQILSTAQAGGGDTGEPVSQALVGSVSPNKFAGKKVVAKYYKQTEEGWELQQVDHPVVDEFGVFYASFSPIVPEGTCKVTAKFKGNDNYKASKAGRVIDCATGQAQS